jgi:hypothetical protein
MDVSVNPGLFSSTSLQIKMKVHILLRSAKVNKLSITALNIRRFRGLANVKFVDIVILDICFLERITVHRRLYVKHRKKSTGWWGMHPHIPWIRHWLGSTLHRNKAVTKFIEPVDVEFYIDSANSWRKLRGPVLNVKPKRLYQSRNIDIDCIAFGIIQHQGILLLHSAVRWVMMPQHALVHSSQSSDVFQVYTLRLPDRLASGLPIDMTWITGWRTIYGLTIHLCCAILSNCMHLYRTPTSGLPLHFCYSKSPRRISTPAFTDAKGTLWRQKGWF